MYVSTMDLLGEGIFIKKQNTKNNNKTVNKSRVK